MKFLNWKKRNWRDEISPYVKDLLSDYKDIAQGCEIHFNGDFGSEVHEGEDKHRILGLGGEEMIQFFLIGFGSKDVNMGLVGKWKFGGLKFNFSR